MTNPHDWNLDTMSPSELREFASWIKTWKTRLSGAVCGELSTYASYKARAIELRLSGQISVAQKLEDACDDIYARLPAWARW
jgi:hypothetical protein